MKKNLKKDGKKHRDADGDRQIDGWKISPDIKCAVELNINENREHGISEIMVHQIKKIGRRKLNTNNINQINRFNG